MKIASFYKWSALTMLLLNIGLLTFLIIGIPPHPPGDRASFDFRQEAVRLLDLNDEQRSSFLQMADTHRQRMTELNERQKKLFRDYFSPLTQPKSTIDKNDIIKSIQSIEEEKISFTYQHFEEVGSILKEGQLSNYKQFIKSALRPILL